MGEKQIPVHGQHVFTLGALYDERSQQVLMGHSPWSNKTIENGKVSKKIATSHFEVSVADSLQERCKLMKVEGSLQLGIMCGIIKIEGAGKFLNENTESKKTSRVALYYEKQTKIERIPMEMITKLEYPEVFDQADATHVVVGVQYGAKAVFDFRKSFDTEKAKLEAGGSLKAQIDKIPMVTVGVEGVGQYQTNETDSNENIHCKYSGDFEMDRLPTNLKEAVHIYQELPSKLSENDSKAVPMVAWLLPISELDNKHQKISRELDEQLMKKCIKLNEELDELMARTNDLRTNDTVQKFPSLLKKLDTFCSTILDTVDTKIKKKLKDLIPEVRYGRKDTGGITNLLEETYSSNYSPSRLQEWIDVKKQEVAFLENITSDLTAKTNIKLCASEAEHINQRKQIDICFKINIEKRDEFLENYSDPIQDSKIEITPPFYSQNEEQISKMKNQLKMFAIANQEPNKDSMKDEGPSFHVKEDSMKDKGPSSISVWLNGKQKELDHLPTEPTNPKITEEDFDQVRLTWDPPEFGAGSVEKIILKYFTTGEETENTIEVQNTTNTALIQYLSPLTKYEIQISLKTEFGMSPSIKTTFETKAAEAPRLLRIVNIGVNSVNIEWDHPLKKHSDTILESYQVKVMEFDKNSGEQKEIESKTLNISTEKYLIEGLKEKCEYTIFVTCITNKGHTKSSVQNVSTTAKGGFPPELLKDMFGIIQAENFLKAKAVKDISAQLNELNKAKEKANAENISEAWVGQLILTPEVENFVRTLKATLETALKTEKEVFKGKLKDLLHPLDTKRSSQSPTMQTLLSLIEDNPEQETTILPCEKIENMTQFIKLIESYNSPVTGEELRVIKESMNDFQDTDLLQINQIGHALFCEVKKKFNRETESNNDVNLYELVLTLQDVNKKVLEEKTSKLAIINGLEIFLARGLLSDKSKIYNLMKTMDINLDQAIIDHICSFLADGYEEEQLKEFLKYAREDRETEYIQNVSDKERNHEIKSLVNYSKFKHQSEEKPIPKNKIKELILKMIDDFGMHDFAINFSTLYPIPLPRNEVKDDTPTPFNFLVKLFQLDYRCRDINSGPAFVSGTSDEEPIPDLDEEDDFDNIVDKSNTKVLMSSRDSVLIALLCCDGFIIQEVFNKMSACQLAIPILMPSKNLNRDNVFHLWASRGIKKKWIENSDNKLNQNIVHEGLVASRNVHTISFIRIGDLKRNSKSKVVNTYLTVAQGGKEQSIFMTKDQDSRSKLNQGTIETTWFTPEGQTGECLNDLTCIYNLRGDARDFKDQREFLEKVSSWIVILDDGTVDKEMYNSIRDSSKKHLLIMMDKAGDKKEVGNNLVRILGKEMNVNELAKCISETIKFDEGAEKLSLMHHSQVAKEKGFCIDELGKECSQSKAKAEKFIGMIERTDPERRKSAILPLQGELWKRWSKFDKELSKKKDMGKSDPSVYEDKKRTDKIETRKQQQTICISEELRYFIETVCSVNEDERRYFLQWCQLELNKISEVILPDVLSKYNECTKRLDDAKSQKAKREKEKDPAMSGDKIDEEIKKENMEKKKIIEKIDEEIKKEKMEMKKISQEFEAVSMGIEHLFREFGQLYEAHDKILEGNSTYNNLPMLMVDFMVMGYPLELMDGDVSHVPVTWLKAVFTELENKIGENSRVSVLSIIGIQSSGKSTLLNTMFGSKFAVSSGRCTKGVFLQLFPLKEDLRETLKCDYVLIMDSEGLRSPELEDQFEHDNEIATFITSLANTTILNFWGQTFSKDMSDLIQIASQAFMRMESVQLKSSFHMVFAGVSDITAEGRNNFGVQAIINEIDDLIKETAINEGKSEIHGMKSIFPLCNSLFPHIQFPQFLPSLWQGSMSAPVSRYGELVKTLRNSLIQSLSSEESSGFRRTQTIKDFMTRISDVWKAVKTESFIFAFRNSQAIHIYKGMQEFYDSEMSTLRTFIFDEVFKIGNNVKKDNLENIKQANSELKLGTLKVRSNVLEKQCTEIEEKFVERQKTVENPDMAAKFLPEFISDMRRKVDSWVETDENQILNEILGMIKTNENIIAHQEFKRTIASQALAVVTKLHDNNEAVDDTVIEDEFTGLFDQWQRVAKDKDKASLSKRDTDISQMESFSQLILFERAAQRLHKKNETIMQQLEKHGVNIISLEPTAKDLKQTGLLKSLFGSPEYLDIKKADELKTEMFRNIEKSFKKASQCSDANVKVLDDLMDEILNMFTKEVSNGWFFKSDYILDFLIYVHLQGKQKLREIIEEQFSKNSLVQHLENERKTLLDNFSEDIKATDRDARLGTVIFQDILLEVIAMKTKSGLGQKIYNDILKSKFFLSKSYLMFYLHKELLQATGKQVHKFCNQYKSYVEEWIQNKMIVFCEENEYLSKQVESRTKNAVEIVIETVQKALKDAQANKSTPFAWFELLMNNLTKDDDYSKELKEKQTVFEIRIKPKTGESDKIKSLDLDTVSTKMIEGLNEFKSNISQLESDDTKTVVESLSFNLIENLINERIGCTAQCPFCGSVCDHGIDCAGINRKHVVELHRPQGLGGMRFLATHMLVTSNCSTDVSTDATYRGVRGVEEGRYYKNVATDIPDWTIKPETAEAQEFWQRLFYLHNKEIAEIAGAEPANIPIGWSNVTEERALTNLKVMYQVIE
eukprot:GFUD01004010.1.p1 GENE.GFUD01004010.1~~GFUD01004010.1.p1  ORF type:complete len:2638 (-),score=679.59 GFUD01004010.1:412-8325(-)